MNKFLLCVFVSITVIVFAEDKDPHRYDNFHNMAIEPMTAEMICGQQFFPIKLGNHFYVVREFFHSPMCPCSDEELDQIYDLIDSNFKNISNNQ